MGQNWDTFLGQATSQERRRNRTMTTITKIAAVIALAATTLSLGACCHKKCCQQPAPCKSK
jgi:hypothetical protein